MIYFSSARERIICSCNTNYIQDGIKHPDRTLDEYDFLYIKNGTWEIYEEDICYPLKEKQMLILEPGRHHFSLEKCSPKMRNMYIHCTHLPEDYTQDIPAGSCMHTPDTACGTDFFMLQKVTDCSGSTQIEPLILQIIETYWSGCRHRIQRLESLFLLMLAELESLGESSSCSDPVVTDIIHRFYLCPDRFFSPRELAGEYHISVRSLSERFKKATGTSIHRYQTDLKLNFASEQIPLYPDRRLKDIALDLGFYDEFQFSKLFKRKFGCPPSDRR